MSSLDVLIGSAIGVGFVHTLLGVDHSLPFVVLGKAQGWSLRRTLGLTALCGVGHVLASVVLGGFGVGLGVAAGRLEWVEGWRGGIASWTLVAFGLGYAGWSLARQRRRQSQAHAHGGTVHSHEHRSDRHEHRGAKPAAISAWSLFVIFVLGPCEPLIPLLMVPAFALGAWAIVPVVLAFGITTLATMLAVVTVGYFGMRLPLFEQLESYAHPVAGLAIAASGLAIMLLGI